MAETNKKSWVFFAGYIFRNIDAWKSHSYLSCVNAYTIRNSLNSKEIYLALLFLKLEVHVRCVFEKLVRWAMVDMLSERESWNLQRRRLHSGPWRCLNCAIWTCLFHFLFRETKYNFFATKLVVAPPTFLTRKADAFFPLSGCCFWHSVLKIEKKMQRS